jgi:hypothetical protein
MLFLLNAVVLKLPETVALPRGLEPLVRMTPAGVLQAGGEIYARHPRLEHERQDIALWYCGLLARRFPAASGALFTKAQDRYFGRLASIDFPVLARLYKLQRDGVSIEKEAWLTVWTRAAAPLPA